MVIIETTPSVDNPLTPTAPPFSRQQSYADDDDFFYTPTANTPKSPPSDRCYDSLKKSLELGWYFCFICKFNIHCERFIVLKCVV